MYIESLTTQSITKQDVAKYQAQQNPSHQVDQFWKQKTRGFLRKGDSLKNKVWPCPRIKNSTSQSIILVEIESRVSQSDFDQQLHRKNAFVPHPFLSEVAGKNSTLILYQNALSEEEGRWVPSNHECQKVQKFYRQGPAAYGSVRNLAKVSNLLL